MLALMIAEVKFDPVAIGFFGPVGKIASAHKNTQLVHETRGIPTYDRPHIVHKNLLVPVLVLGRLIRKIKVDCDV